MVRRIDLSHEIGNEVITYKGLPAPIVCDWMNFQDSHDHYAPGTEFHIGKVEMVANSGTYLDAPFHRFRDGEDIADLPLEKLVHLPVRKFSIPPDQTEIGPEWFDHENLQGMAILVHTSWDRHWGSDHYFEGHPHLTSTAAELLRERGAVLVGIDSLNIDGTQTGERPVHTILLGAGILVVEHLCNLHLLPEAGFYFHAAPVKLRGMGAFPVRAYALMDV